MIVLVLVEGSRNFAHTFWTTHFLCGILVIRHSAYPILFVCEHYIGSVCGGWRRALGNFSHTVPVSFTIIGLKSGYFSGDD